MKAWLAPLAALALTQTFSLTTDAQNQPRPRVESEGPSVVSVTPQNLSNTVNQVRVKFSEKMINLSAPTNQAEIFKLNCSPQVQGRARWNDDKTWVFDFETEFDGNFLPGGTRCQMELKEGVKGLAGAPLVGVKKYQFQIDGPNVIAMNPPRWGSEDPVINEDQIFILTLDTGVEPDSVLKNVYFSVDGKASPVAVRFIEGIQRNEILKSQLGENLPKTPILLVQAREVFAAKSKVTLVWGPGITTVKGGMTRQLKATYQFLVREELRAHFTCGRENAEANCSPVTPLEIEFTSRISTEKAKQIRLVAADGTVRQPDLGQEKEQTVQRVSFRGPFPENAQFKIEMPSELKDDAGRELKNLSSYPLQVRTARFPPLAKFPASFGILESEVKPVMLPATLRNLEARVLGHYSSVKVGGAAVRLSAENLPQVIKWMQVLSERSDYESREKSVLGKEKDKIKFEVPLKQKGASFEVVGIPLPGPGFYVVELQSRILGNSLLGKDRSMYVPSSALVTNLAVHLKWGAESSLFWVTSLDSGSPVAGAKVALHDCAGKQVWQGSSDKDGLVRYSANLKTLVKLDGCNKKDAWGSYRGGFFVSATKGGDFTFTHTSWNNGLEAYRFGSLPNRSPSWEENKNLAHTVFARTLVRAGDTVHMKHILRRPNSSGFGLVNPKELPSQVWIEHAGSGLKFTFPIQWDSLAQVAETTYELPKEAKLGYYSVSLVKNGGKDWSDVQASGSFRVDEFKIPLMKGVISLPKSDLVQPGEVRPQITLSYKNGGAAAGAEVVFRYSTSDSQYTASRDYEDFTFMNGKVQAGIKRWDNQSQDDQDKVVTEKLKLSEAGAGVAHVKGLSGLTVPKDIRMELEFRDANGEIQTIGQTARVWPSDRLIGIRSEHWVAEDKDIEFQVLILDLKRKPLANQRVNVSSFKEETYSHRKRLVGGFYAYENISETTKLNDQAKCSAQTDARGLVFCSVRASVSGRVLLMAETSDDKGNKAYANAAVYVRGENDWWFSGDDNDRIDLVPEKRRYEPGETARLQVRMPFRNATALVTFEREGILDAKVMQISSQNPIIELALKDEHAPNVFVSAFLIRGRVKGAEEEKGKPGQDYIVDLNKPAFKMGATQLYVNWKAHELKVAVTANKEIYQPREEASVKVVVKDSSGKPARGEFAFAVVDEGLLQLEPNGTWDLLKAMMGQRSWEVETSTAQMQVIGKRHFGQKAVAHGGGGGRQPTRELFDTLVTWQPRVKLNENGEAIVRFPLNDSLTKFRVVAVAQSGISLFGSGETSISSTQDLIAIAGQAPLARQRDKFSADLTLRNTTKKTINATVCGQVTFTFVDQTKQVQKLECQSTALEAEQGIALVMGQVTVPVGAIKASYEYSVAGDTGQKDKLVVTQEIKPLLVARTQMAQLEQLGDKATVVGIERPKDADPTQGGVKVTLIDSLARGLTSVREYFENVIIQSFENQVSASVALNDLEAWNKLMKRLPNQLDQDGLVKWYPGCDCGGYELTAYVVAIAKDARFDIPQDSLSKMQTALVSVVEGRLRRERLGNMSERALLYLRINAMAALSRYQMARGEWLTSLTLPATEQLPSATLIDLMRIHLSAGPGRGEVRKSIESALQARLTVVGTRMEIAPEKESIWWMFNSRAGNQARLISLLTTFPELMEKWRSDLPKLQSGLMRYMNRGSWDTSVTNAYAAVAMRHFARAVESGKVAGSTLVEISGKQRTHDWAVNPSGGLMNLAWPADGLGQVTLSHKGAGTPWAMIATVAAVPVRGENFVGISIKKTIKPLRQEKAGEWRRGDVAEVTLKVKAQAPTSQVALFDPIPAGAKILGAGLTGSDPRSTAWVWPEFDEKSYDGYRAVYSYVPTTEFEVVYRIQLNLSGTFNLPATRLEAIYTPETFAELANPGWTVKP